MEQKTGKQHKRFGVILRRYGRIIIGGTVLVALIIVAISAPSIAKFDPLKLDPYNVKCYPNAEHLMGTDGFGRDIFSRVVYGTRISLLVGVAVSALSAVLGIILGLLMGYYKKVDMVGMRILEGVSAFPSMLLAMTLAAVLGSGVDKIIIAIGVVSTPSVAKIVRSQALSIREAEHVESAKAMGASDFRIIFTHILPLCMSPLIIRITSGMASAILTEASLSFLGVGISPNIPTWGGVLSEAKQFVIAYPFMVVYPGLAIIVTVLSISILGDGLRDVLDPKLK
ncbi:MAG: ABC transporter permease [Oscillospiraceae bacterium]|nr:ABC transporter permease [Oscillospiraceae bacterium]